MTVQGSYNGDALNRAFNNAAEADDRSGFSILRHPFHPPSTQSGATYPYSFEELHLARP